MSEGAQALAVRLNDLLAEAGLEPLDGDVGRTV